MVLYVMIMIKKFAVVVKGQGKCAMLYRGSQVFFAVRSNAVNDLK